MGRRVALLDAFRRAMTELDVTGKLIATDLYAVQKEGDADTLKLVETSNPLLSESHCDVAYSAGLARKAASITYAQPWVTTAA